MSSPVMLRTPLAAAAVRALRAGQEVLLTGTVFTARDRAHRYLAERPDEDGFPFDLSGGVIYHCGPIMRKSVAAWEAVSAGPTTSNRMEMYEARVITRYGVASILGKGGMGAETAKALSDTGAVYLAAAPGAGPLVAKRIVSVEDVWKLDEFGEPEAIWKLAVENFPAIVAMDSHGGNVYTAVETRSAKRLQELLARTRAHQ